jgi:hypothetical protein
MDTLKERRIRLVAKKKLPKVIYVFREVDGDDSYLLCADDVEELSQMGEVRKVGVYELKEEKTLTTKVELTD